MLCVAALTDNQALGRWRGPGLCGGRPDPSPFRVLGQAARGEAAHFRQHAIDLDVHASAVLLEPNAANTGQNITLSRQVPADAGITPTTVPGPSQSRIDLAPEVRGR
ncbi:hypothetical protein GCM10010431_41930 [Streptomyces kunmingensis]